MIGSSYGKRTILKSEKTFEGLFSGIFMVSIVEIVVLIYLKHCSFTLVTPLGYSIVHRKVTFLDFTNNS